MAENNLWSPTDKNNFLTEFITSINKKNFFKGNDYELLHKWSINNKKKFWSEVWNFTSIIGEYKDPVVENENDFINSIFFKNSKLNFSQNLIKIKDDSDAIVFYSEKGFNRRISWKQLDEQVSKIAHYFYNQKIQKGERVGAVLPNIPEAVISFLGAAKIGAIWSSCSADFGPQAIIDRFKQIEPKILLISDHYFYNNNKINTLENIRIIKDQIPSIKQIVIIPYDNKIQNYNVNFEYKNWIDIINKSQIFDKYENFNFNTPLNILYSSGTTGVPKCIVHGAGGSLIQHKKEHQLHCNIKPKDKVFYFTTCGWMMWNWLVSCLASKATIYLYDGSPFYPKIDHLFEIAQNEKITFFGTGAKYIDTLRQNKVEIYKKYDLKNLETIASTGSPLVHESFHYVYEKIKKNVQLTSISGGTDIVSCFVLGNPNLPIYAGEIQCKALGMDVAIFDDEGKEIHKKRGELVCKSSFPSKPLFFWNDNNNIKLQKEYFNKYNNVWHQSDYAESTENNGYIIYGRSDATLNSGGVRIGTAELYRVVENINNVMECMAVEQKCNNDTIILLFVKLKNNIQLDGSFINIIKEKIKSNLSPKHIPAKIIDVSDIPKTKSGKIVELAIKKIVNNEKINNLNSIANPECLEEFRKKSQIAN
ncbi:MAG: acetoacetate--CoA ligase [Pelagibacteraceae bacterium]|jgi:acetoacetyl-CoA synthetase|nr:acetoacetate--CoA ligase [Pelagibacteraceae bacterium]HJO14140.1 acetoacetate--CoA ligase [Alphaproteobacteria bacterium]MBO6466464.1 acetoacetate--CoA ligase [Pelagibacteraceae bacterium]MBO6468221.1 acetoacetate--CoA ligase [Pelagibacteraceae bacterium]MBO6468975.1 acetoacetate--CoA ligase [Pelagibacteraceae bacterium]